MNKIQELRKKKGLTQSELARIAGISEISIRKYENGERHPKYETLAKISEGLNVPLTELLEQDPVKPTVPVPPGKIYLEIGDDDKNGFYVDPIEFQKAFNNIVQQCCPNQASKLLEKFYLLNITGQDKAIEQVDLLTKIPEYLKDY